MSQQSDASAVQAGQDAPVASQSTRWRAVAPAPSGDLPDAATKSGRQVGLVIILASGAAFWGAVAGAVAMLS